MPYGLKAGASVWAKFTLFGSSKSGSTTNRLENIQVYGHTHGIVLGRADHMDSMRVKVSLDARREIPHRTLSLDSADLQLTKPNPLAGGYIPGDPCWCAHRLIIGRKSQTINVGTRGVVIGEAAYRIGDGLAVQFEGIDVEVYCSPSNLQSQADRNSIMAMEQNKWREMEALRIAKEEEEEKELRRHEELLAQAKAQQKEKAEAARLEKASRAEEQRQARREEAKKAQAQQKDPEGLGSLIYRAVCSNEYKQLKKLLDRLAKEKPTARRQVQQWTDAESGATPLYAACNLGNFDCARLLLDRHYSATKPCADGLPPLHGAVKRGSLKLVELLLDAGADTTVEASGASLVDLAVELSFDKIAEKLRQRSTSKAPVGVGGEEADQAVASGGAASSGDLAPVPVPVRPQRKREAPSSLAAITEGLEEEDEEQEWSNEDGSSPEDGAKADAAAAVIELLEKLEQSRTPEALNNVMHELVMRKADAPAYLAVDDALATARARLKRLRLAGLDPLYNFASELPADLPHDGRPVYTAHTIMVVDCSGSMRTEDVATGGDGEPPLSRMAAVRRAILQTYLKPQLVAGAQQGERFSLIKIQPEASEQPALPFALFPLDASLAPRIDAVLDEPRGAGPYLPALRKLNELVAHSKRHLFERARTQVLFLSDGRPSDASTGGGIDERQLPSLIQSELTRLAELLDGNLEQFQLLGFGEADEATLKMMADAVPGRIATHQIVSGTSGYALLTSSVATFSSNSSVSRTASVCAPHESRKPMRRVNTFVTERMELYRDCVIQMPPKELGDFISKLQELRGAHDVLISNTLLGYGGERNAYLMRFARDNKFTTADEEWVVKESRRERSDEEDKEFHRTSLITQNAAITLATKFNEEVEELGLRGLPKVSYMTCCTLQTYKMERRDGQPVSPDEPEIRNLFAERRIDGQFRKWNTNHGTTIATVEVADSVAAGSLPEAADGETVQRLNTDLVPHAFSHFTIAYSERPLNKFRGPEGKTGPCLVCDLQGEHPSLLLELRRAVAASPSF